jgi:hypothetical protein
MTMVDPRMPTDPVSPPYATLQRPTLRALAELRDHLWPWHRAAFRRHAAGQGLALLAALAASAVWVLAAAGELASGVVIGGWFGWSLLEILVRLDTKPYVKEGPWWGARYRAATVMDMICYVLFKNLLVGALLFLSLKGLGLLAA